MSGEMVALIEKVLALGPAGVLAVVYWLERKRCDALEAARVQERKEFKESLDKLWERVEHLQERYHDWLEYFREEP